MQVTLMLPLIVGSNKSRVNMTRMLDLPTLPTLGDTFGIAPDTVELETIVKRVSWYLEGPDQSVRIQIKFGMESCENGMDKALLSAGWKVLMMSDRPLKTDGTDYHLNPDILCQ